MEKIDFVMPWVDGSDPEWLASKRKFENSGAAASLSDADANADCRYRDDGLLKYWFRSVEKFAPWVHRIFFVTCGQKPDWLDETNPKLRCVNHDEYIPAAHLPTFHSNTIEMNLHRIGDLSEYFVLFNDDIFLMRPCGPEEFFADGLPVVPCDLGIPRWLGYSNTSRIALNNCGALKLGLEVERLVRKNILKFADVRRLGFARAVKNVVSFAVNRVVMPGTFGHIAYSHLKSTFAQIWRAVPEIIETASRSRFRTDDSVNHWLACAWNMVSGRFVPANEKLRGRFFTLGVDSLDSICDSIRNQTYGQICLNDKGSNSDPQAVFSAIASAFESILPEKSSFEKC